jgi:hypothetical protein
MQLHTTNRATICDNLKKNTRTRAIFQNTVLQEPTLLPASIQLFKTFLDVSTCNLSKHLDLHCTLEVTDNCTASLSFGKRGKKCMMQHWEKHAIENVQQ